jgi:hypothetical protein
MKYSTVELPFGAKYVFKNTNDLQVFFEQAFVEFQKEGISTKIIGCVLYVYRKKDVTSVCVCGKISSNKEVESAKENLQS